MNLIEEIKALSLQDKEKLFSHLGQLIQEEKFYKENEGVRKMEEIKMASVLQWVSMPMMLRTGRDRMSL